MSGDWALIIRGFAIAGTGAASTILFIVALSAAYVGRFSISAVSAATGVALGFTFLCAIGSFLHAIDRRERTEASHMRAPTGKIKS